MPGRVRGRQPWLYLGGDWAASDILVPKTEVEDWGNSGVKIEVGDRRRKESKWKGRVSEGELPEKTGEWEFERVREKERYKDSRRVKEKERWWWRRRSEKRNTSSSEKRRR